VHAKCIGRNAHCFRGGFPIECDRMRQYDRVCLGMGQIERSAQRVTELVMDRHPDVAEHGTRKPRAV
jgi:hypothetical protein